MDNSEISNIPLPPRPTTSERADNTKVSDNSSSNAVETVNRIQPDDDDRNSINRQKDEINHFSSSADAQSRVQFDNNADGYHVVDSESSQQQPGADGLFGEQFDWASFLPYTVAIGEGKWNTWLIISAISLVFGFLVAFFSVGLSDLATIVMFVTAIIATVQIYQARKAYKEAGSSIDIKTVVPRGWVLSIILTVFGAICMLNFIPTP